MANLKVYTHFRLPGSALAPTAVQSVFQERTNKGDGETIWLGTLMSEIGESEGSILSALQEIAKAGRINAPEYAWDEVDGFSVVAPRWELVYTQRRLGLTGRENDGYEVRTIADVPYRVEIALDVEDQKKKRQYLNCWRLNDDGTKAAHIMKGVAFVGRTEAWSYWDRYVDLLGWPYAALRWAESLPSDRRYTDRFGEVREVVYLDRATVAAVRLAAKERSAADGDMEFSLIASDDPDLVAVGHRDYAIAWMGTSLPDDLGEALVGGAE